MFKPLHILVTGAGAPGIQGTLYSLKENYDGRKVTVTGTDMKESVAGRYLTDAFHIIPAAKDTDAYLERLLALCKTGGVDVLVPQNTMELLTLARHRALFAEAGTQILVSEAEAIEAANDKHRLFDIARERDVATSGYAVCSQFGELAERVRHFQQKNGMAVVKPPLSNGSRGVRIVAEQRDRKHDFYAEKPSSLYTTLDELYDILGDTFPELLVMEYLPGDEYTVDVFRTRDRFCAIPRKRETIRSGITFTASLEQNARMTDYAHVLADACGLTLCFGFQFKLDEAGVPVLLESNPRVQGTMVMSTFCGANIIYSSVKSLLGEAVPAFDIHWDTRLYRYWGAIGVHGESMVKI
ncbi:MAG: ATP-grasp domain-containing protein [Bacteroidales bacterium]|nr:ATP-grasp domain-containing protein [Bacteroidales bacterium]